MYIYDQFGLLKKNLIVLFLMVVFIRAMVAILSRNLWCKCIYLIYIVREMSILKDWISMNHRSLSLFLIIYFCYSFFPKEFLLLFFFFPCYYLLHPKYPEKVKKKKNSMEIFTSLSFWTGNLFSLPLFL